MTVHVLVNASTHIVHMLPKHTHITKHIKLQQPQCKTHTHTHQYVPVPSVYGHPNVQSTFVPKNLPCTCYVCPVLTTTELQPLCSFSRKYLLWESSYSVWTVGRTDKETGLTHVVVDFCNFVKRD